MDAETSSDDGKRKRESPEFTQRNKKTFRTPPRKDTQNNTEEMEEIKNMMIEMMKDIKSIRAEQQFYKEEIQEIKRENKELKQAVNKLESKIEMIEKREKKNNIIIKGVKIDEADNSEKLSQLIKDKMEVDIKIKSVQIIKKYDKPIVLARIDAWEDKIQIMKNKHKLRKTDVYIENDMTAEEREVQAMIRNFARQEREKGKAAIVKYRKLIIDGVLWVWDNNQKMLIENTKN